MRKITFKQLMTRIISALLVFTMLISSGSMPAYAATKKKLSKSSENVTAVFKAKKVKSLKSDATFKNAMANSAVKLLQETIKQDKSGGNILISPDSVFSAVEMAYLGSAKKTRSEIKKTLGGIDAKKYAGYLKAMHKRIHKSKSLTYDVANSLWYKKKKITMKKSFLKNVVSYSDADIYAAPFNKKTVTDINNWTYNNTNGKIPSIIQQLDPDARCILINAIYFKGAWEDQYPETVKRPFTDEKGAVTNKKMLEGTEHVYVQVNGAEGFVKPYRGGQIAFVGLLPPEGTSVDDYVAG